MGLNRREVLKGGAAGLLIGFLFRGRGDKLEEQPEVVDQPPSAVTIRVTPQQAFRPSHLMIAGTVVGKRMVPQTRFVSCGACGGRDIDEDDETFYCDVCDGSGGHRVETGEMVERVETAVPWSIESLMIGSAHQLAQAGAIPGQMFSASAFDSSVGLDAAAPSQEIAIVVRYTGTKPEGEVFQAALYGTSLEEDGVRRQVVLPICSEQKIVA